MFTGFAKELSFSVFSRVKTALVTNQQQVRTATKRAGGSRTHMKDSRGRRLGPKKHEGEAVKTGQIILRQRGTKWYPGFNVGIGRDHTLFALEPGFVRYYLDPFHPKRKFIGIALNEKDRLPYPHFDPTPRRLNRKVLVNQYKADAEEQYMSRKESLNMPEILEKQEARELNRAKKYEFFMKTLESKQFVELSSEEELKMGALRLVKIDGFFRGGKSLEDSRYYATYDHLYDMKLELKRGEISAEELARKSDLYKKVADLIDSSIMFDPRFKLVKNIPVEDQETQRNTIISEIKQVYNSALPTITSEIKSKLQALIDSPVFTLSQQVRLRRKYLKPVLPESLEGTVSPTKTKDSTIIKRIDYLTGKTRTIFRTKTAYIGKA